jgi:hypothetical protein
MITTITGIKGKERGGCITVPFTPLFILLIFSAIFLMATGETTSPWDLTPTNENTALTLYTTSNASSSQSIIEPEAEVKPKGRLTPLFTPEVMHWEENILAWSKDWGLDPNLVATVMQIESCGDPRALSRSGAMGLFQVMPYHFASDEMPYKPNTNAKRGLAYLRKALDEHRSPRLAFAGYNGGISRAGGPENEWKSETVRYVYWGTNIYRDAQNGHSSSPTLDEWLAYGGASLCAQANQRLGLSP